MKKFETKLRDPSNISRPTVFKTIDDYGRMKIIFTIFKLFGLAPWQITRESIIEKSSNDDFTHKFLKPQLIYSEFGCAHHVILVIAMCALFYVTLPAVSTYEYEFKTPLTVTIEQIQAVCGNAIIVGLRLMLCIRQKTFVDFFNRFTNINEIVTRLANGRSTEFNGMFYIPLFVSNALVWATIIVTEHTCYDASWKYLINLTLPAMTITWFIMQYVIMVKLVECRFRALNRGLLQSFGNSGTRTFPSLISDDFHIDPTDSPTILSFRRTHTVLYEISCEISEFYSLPILFVLGFTCYLIIYNAYFFIMPIVMDAEDNSMCVIFNAVAWLVGLTLPIVMLSALINRTDSEMRKSADAVHKLLGRVSISQETKTELQQFSLELLQRNIDFSAYGLFSLDCTLVHSIFSTVVTYLIILFQFRLSGQKNGSELEHKDDSTVESSTLKG